MTTQYLVLKNSAADGRGVTMLDRVFYIETDASMYARATGGWVVPNTGEEIVIRDTYHYWKDNLGWFKYRVVNRLRSVYRIFHHPTREQKQ